MSLRGLIAISGIFGSKNEDLDILPPPPPFPDIGIGKKPKDAAEEEWKQGKQKREEDRKTKMEFERQKGIEKKKGEEQRKKQEEMQKKLLEKQKKFDVKKEKIKIPKPKQKKSFFGKLFGKKDEELEKELEELEEIRPEPRLAARKLPELGIPKAKGKSPIALERAKPLKYISQAKPPRIKFEEEIGLDEMKKDEEEIKKAIDGMKEKKKVNIIGRLLKRKVERPNAQISDAIESGKIETPEVMPRTFDKIDNVLEIEGRIHKARMCLMDFKFDDAKRIYMEIMRLYRGISQKDRYKVYQDIKDLYYERKSAEKFFKI